MPMPSLLKPVLDIRAQSGEGPCWDEENKLLYWVDILGKCINIFDTVMGTNRSIYLGQAPGALALRKNGSLVAALQHGFYFIDPVTAVTTFICDPEFHLTGNRFNDGKCDAKGRFWAGTSSSDGYTPTGALYRLDKDLSYKKMLPGVCNSNGITWAPDNRTMYYIDTGYKKVDAFDFDLDSGEISNRRTIITFAELGILPDGMTCDTEGMLWIALYGGWNCTRWNPDTGKMTDRIELPAKNVSSCTFGGESMDELYITTIRDTMTKEEQKAQSYAGSIFKISVNVKGLPLYRFAG